MPPSQLSVSGIRGQKRQLWATQTMQDVISPKAFEQWTKDQTIPRAPDHIWSASDMRKAHTFKKRQWKLSKPDFKHLKLDNILSTALHKQTRPKGASAIQKEQQSAARQAIYKAGKEAKQDAERPPVTASRLQSLSQARTRVLNEAFRGLLSPAQQRRAVSHKGLALSKDFYISEILLTARIMNLITMYESGSPRERICKLLKPHRVSGDEKHNITSASTDAKQKEEKARMVEKGEHSVTMLEGEFYDHFRKWRTATEELREAVEMKWPGKSKKTRMKTAIEQEMEEIRLTEKMIQDMVIE